MPIFFKKKKCLRKLAIHMMCNVLLYLWHDCVTPASFPPICFPIPEVSPHSCYILPFARNNVNHDQNDIYSHSPILFQSCTCVRIAYTLLYFMHILFNCMPCYGRRFQWYALRFECNAIWFVCYAMRYWNKRLHYVVHYFMFCCEIWKKRLHIQKMSTQYEVK